MSQIIMPALGGLRRNSTATDVIDMEASSRAASVVALVLLCTLLANFVQRILPSNWQFPDSNLAIIVGFFSALPLCSAATRPGKDFDTIFFLYLVPPILFESGYSLNQKDFFRNFTAIMLFAVVGTLISSIVTGMGLFYLARANWLTGIDPSSPRQGLLFGTLLSATDTVATIAVLRQMGVEPQLYALIFGEAHSCFPSLVNIAACVPTPSQHAGESVLNDAVAVVLFQTVSSLSDDETNFHVSGQAILATAARFSGVFVGSVALGVAFGLLTALITKHVLKNAYAHSEVTIMICLAYLAFIVADDLDLSGLMAVFFAGIVMSHYAKYNLSAHGQQTTHHVARTLANWGELLTFMYFGFTILPVVNPSCESADGPEHLYKIEWSFVFWTLILCVLARGAAVLPLTALVNLLKRRERQRANRISLRSMLMLWFSILRGAVSFALGLTIEDTNRRYMIPCIVMVILFTNLFFGQATVPVLRLLKIPIGFTQEDETHEVDVVSPASASVGRLHTLWRYVDEVHIKPLFGGRQRGVYRVQRTIYDDGDSFFLCPLFPFPSRSGRPSGFLVTALR
jgi:sodium/hydrogen exchanger 8